MVYQISEKNQILIALFAIVVLCAGKLFKDYLYRGGYVEGLAVIPAANTVLRRNASSGVDLSGVNFYLNLTLGAQLTATATAAANKTITVSWPVLRDVSMNNSAWYYAISGGRFSNGDVQTSNNISSLTFTLNDNQTLNPGSKITIAITGVTINKEATTTSTRIDFDFTTKAGTEPAVVTPITILGSAGGGVP